MAGELVAVVGILVPVTAIIMGITLAIIAVNRGFKKEQEKQTTIRLAIEKGVDLPEELFKDYKRIRERSPITNLRNGLIFTFLGIALSIALWFVTGTQFVWGLIPLAIGIAYLIFYFVIKDKKVE